VAGLILDKLSEDVRGRVRPFFEEILGSHLSNVHSIHITGSSLTGDFNPKASDTNSVVVLKEMDLGFLETLAPMGKKYRKKKVAAPLIMTPGYIENSLDVFPVEFLNIKLIHQTVFGDDVFAGIELNTNNLRHQCERELKVKLIGLRQGYISAMGDVTMITEGLGQSITGYIPLFRALLVLLGKEPPALNADVLKALDEATGFDCSIFHKLLEEKKLRQKPAIGELNAIFKEYYHATERLGKVVNDIKA
jgi:hypothetical protein